MRFSPFAAVLLASAAAIAAAPSFAHRHLTGPVFPLSDALPNPQLTPGAIDPRVTQANIHSTICRRGYTKTVRPPESYTERLKRLSIRQYGYDWKHSRLRYFEFDHLLSLALGGAPRDPRNLWPEPHRVVGNWGAYTKDRLENKLHRMVCRGQITLREAQYEEVHDWIAAYKRYIGMPPAR